MRVAPAALVVVAVSHVLAAEAPPPPLEARLVVVERTVRSEGRDKVRTEGEEKRFRLDGPEWRAASGADEDPQLRQCIEQFAASVASLRADAALRGEIETRAAGLVAGRDGASVAVALHVQRDIDIDAQLAEIDAGSVRLRPATPRTDVPDPLARPGDQTWNAGAEIETVKAPDADRKKAPAPARLKRQVRVLTGESSQTLASRALGSLAHAFTAGACRLDADALRALLDDAARHAGNR